MIGEQFDQRIAEALPQATLDKGAAALATEQKALCFEALNVLAQGGTRNVELFGQLAFRRKLFTGAQRPLKNLKLQLLLNHIGQFRLADFAVSHGSLS